MPETHNTFEITDFTESGNGSKILKLTLAYLCLFVYLLLIVYFVFAFFFVVCLFVCFAFLFCFSQPPKYMKKVSPCETPTETLNRQLDCYHYFTLLDQRRENCRITVSIFFFL